MEKYRIYNFHEKGSSKNFSPTRYQNKKPSVIRICRVNTLRAIYKAINQVQDLIKKIQVTYSQAALQEYRASDTIGQTGVHTINLAQLGSLETEPKLVPFNHLEELPHCWLYQVPRSKEQEDNKDEFSTIFSDTNYSSPSSSTTDKLSVLSDTDSTVSRIT